MGTTSEKLTYLNTTKTLIKEELNLGGANITTEPFRQYKTKLEGIYKDFLANGTDTLWNNWEKVSGSGETLTLNNTIEAKMKLDLKGNTQQNGTPTPDTPIPIQVVSGDNTIKVEGKNLFDKDNPNVITGYINSSGVISASNDNRTIWLPIKQNTDYAIKMTAVGITGSTIGDDVKIGLTKTQPAIGNQTNLIYSQATARGVNYTHEKTFNSEDYNYVAIKICNTSRTNYEENIATLQICIGSTIPTSYYPYQSQTYPISLGAIELCKIGTYQDKIYKDNGKWYLHKEIGKVVLNGTQNITISNWRATASSVGWIYPYSIINSITSSSIETTPQIICNKLIPANINDLYNGAVDNGIGLWQDTSYGIVVRTSDTTLTNVSLINTYLSNNPMSVYVPLATPTNTEITDSTLLEQLNNLYNANSYEETTNVSQVNDDMPFILDITALKNI